MNTRAPAVAGTFYEGAASRLQGQVDACFAAAEQPADLQPFIGAVVPHAGLMYSGHVAASFYAMADLPRRLIILCPNHTGAGHFAAINHQGAWRTPFGDAPIDTELAEAMMSRTTLLREDAAAHAREHSLEVQLPFLQKRRPDFSFVPVCLAAPRYEICDEIGRAIAEVVGAAGEPVGVLASSDLNHYEDQATTLRKDQMAIDAVLALDARALWNVIEQEDISMCGYIPTTTMLIAAGALGARKARLLRHATSGDINRDYDRVVGYAAIIIQ